MRWILLSITKLVGKVPTTFDVAELEATVGKVAMAFEVTELETTVGRLATLVVGKIPPVLEVVELEPAMGRLATPVGKVLAALDVTELEPTVGNVTNALDEPEPLSFVVPGSVANVLVGRTATLEVGLEEVDPMVDTTLVTNVPTALDLAELKTALELDRAVETALVSKLAKTLDDVVELDATVELRTVLLVLLVASA